MAKPSHALTLTGVSSDWSVAKRQMERFHGRLRTQGVSGQHAFHVEPYDSGADCHVHGWWYGGSLTKRVLGDAAASAHLGSHVHVEPAWIPKESYARPALEYGLKMILHERPECPTELWPRAHQYLDLNGQRLVHATRGFWRDAHGLRLSGIREAKRLAHRGPAMPGAWSFMPLQRSSSKALADLA